MCRGRREGLGNLTVRNLDDWVIEGLKAEAKANERSLEGEVRHVLAQRVGRRKHIADFRERTRQITAMTADTPQTESVTLLREDRDR